LGKIFKKDKSIKSLIMKKESNDNVKYANLFLYFNRKITIYMEILHTFSLIFNGLFELEFDLAKYV